MHAVIESAVTGAAPRQVPQAGMATVEVVSQRLSAEFRALTPEVVEQRVTRTWICAEHLGLAVTAAVVEALAREHLLGLVNSVPPTLRSRR
jgi:hypothetical protein